MNCYNKETWIVPYLTNLFYKINNRNILTLTSNEIDYFYDEPFPFLKTKILENQNSININKRISDNIINNLYKSSIYNYTPLIDFNDDLYQSSSENTNLLDFLSFVNDITTIDMHDYNNNLNEKILSNNNITDGLIIKDNSNDMIIEEELIKKKEEDNNSNMIINIQNSPKNTDILKYLQNTLTFNPHDSEFYKKCSFLCNDATKYNDYHYDPPFDAKKEAKHPFTHIYSYNKLMGDTCKEKICEILNNSDWKVLAWYTNEKQTRESGLENFKFIASFPMTSTGNQKFSCYVYIKKYD